MRGRGAGARYFRCGCWHGLAEMMGAGRTLVGAGCRKLLWMMQAGSGYEGGPWKGRTWGCQLPFMRTEMLICSQEHQYAEHLETRAPDQLDIGGEARKQGDSMVGRQQLLLHDCAQANRPGCNWQVVPVRVGACESPVNGCRRDSDRETQTQIVIERSSPML